MARKALELFTSLKWGHWCLISLYLSVLSGVVVAFQYDDATPIYSSSSLDLLVPFGKFFRSLHFYTSQAFFLLSVIHLIAAYSQSESYRWDRWTKLIFSLPVALLILFTGYILRGDSTGHSAGLIAENILLSVPSIGEDLNSFFFSISENGLKRIYINHIVTFSLLWGVLVWDHLRRYRVSLTSSAWVTAFLFVLCVVIAAPFEPEGLGQFHISGPWFFLGLQELLRYFPPLLAGVVFPLVFLGLLLVLRPQNRFFNPLLILLCSWLVIYGLATAMALYRDWGV